MTAMHPPKREVFDLIAATNTDPKGVVRAVDEYRLYPWGLYMARPTPGRVQFHYLESWLIPRFSLRANVFHFNPGYERDQDHYLDIGPIAMGADCWHTEDHYIDLVVKTGCRTDIVDVDELFEAHRLGMLTTAAAETAVRTAAQALVGLAAHGHDLGAWLASAGVQVGWR